MELSTLKKRLKTARRGHKLLSDKQSEIVKRFITLIHENKRLRESVEKALTDALRQFILAKAMMSEAELETALMIPIQKVSVNTEFLNIMSVIVPKFSIERDTVYGETGGLNYGFATTSGDLDDAMMKLLSAFELLISLAEVEKTCQLLASEIEKTRRRVNALEYVMIPQLEETVRYIAMKLDENERSSRVRLMKVKELVEKKRWRFEKPCDVVSFFYK